MLFLALLEKEGQGSRARIMEALRRQPGMNMSQLCKAVDLNWTTTKYHLKRLQSQGVVELQRAGRRDVRCFPVGIPSKYRPWFATLRDPGAVQVLRFLKGREAGVAAIARELAASEDAARRRLERMLAQGLLTKRGTFRPRYARHPDCPPWADDAASLAVGRDAPHAETLPSASVVDEAPTRWTR